MAAQGAALAARQLADLATLGGGDTGGDAAARRARSGGRGGGAAVARGGGAGHGGAAQPATTSSQDDAAAAAGIGRRGGAAQTAAQLTPLVYAARANDLESVKVLLAAGADINQTTGYGWSPLLVATQNRYYKLARVSARARRQSEPRATRAAGSRSTSRPTTATSRTATIRSARPDMDHLEFIKLLLDKGADVNHRVKDSTETRTVFTNQWLDENGATAFLRASQSGDVELMKLLLARGADPKINTCST